MEVIPMTIIVHYGGEWKDHEGLNYFGGTTRIFDEIPSSFNTTDMRKIIECLGYEDIIKVHYCDPSKPLSTGLRFMSYDDANFTKFVSLMEHYRIIDVYIEHEYEDDENSTYTPFEVGGGGRGTINTIGNDSTNLNTTTSVFDTHNEEVDEGSDYDEEGTDVDDEEIKEAREEVKRHKKKEKEVEFELQSIRNTFDDEVDSDDSDSCPDSPDLSEGEVDFGNLLPDSPKKKNKKVLSHSNHMQTLIRIDDGNHFFIGQEFEDSVEFKKAITHYCVTQGRDVIYTKNSPQRMGAKCKAFDRACPWYIWASVSKNQGTMVVKTLIPKHTCGRVPSVMQLRSKWVAEHYHKKFRVNPYVKCQEIVDTIWLEYGIKVSLWIAKKARIMAQQLILGEYAQQYSMLYRYAAEIMRSNPNNTVKFGLNQGVFQKMYICFDSIKKGFLAGCRPFFGVDGCFLKGPFGGQLLVAVGRDGNNQMFPIAWACVEVEDANTWEWFLELLATDLGTIDGSGYTIMSDQQKGLLKAVTNIWPNAETRVCARHVYCNFRTKFGGGLQYRRGFWKVAKSSTENEFNSNMDLFSKINVKAGEDLLKRNYEKWVRAFQTPQSKCDSIDNNMNEVFNAYILSSRHKPIITMLEDIREGLMVKMQKKRDNLANKEILVCPRIQKALEKTKVAARGWIAYWDGDFKYGVREGGTQVRYVVSLLDRTCSCNVWQLRGYPCRHAVTAIWKAMEHPEHYVSEWLTKAKYLDAYQFSLEPLNGFNEWPICSHGLEILPPPVKLVKHRRTTKRRASAGEVAGGVKLTRKGQEHKCGNCKQSGHNKTTCHLLPKESQGIPKKRKATTSTTTQCSTKGSTSNK